MCAPGTGMFVNVHYVGLTMIIMFILHNENAKSTPNCDVSFANGELHQVGPMWSRHVTKIQS